MSTTIATVTLDAESQLASVLADPAIDLVYVVQNGRRFRLVPVRGADDVSAESSGSLEVSLQAEPATLASIRLADPDDPWKDYDPAKLIAASRALAGILTPEEADAWMADVYAAREAGSRPANRP